MGGPRHRRDRWTARGRVFRDGALIALGAIVVAGIAGVSGCSLRQEGVRPPADRIFFPGGALVDRGGKWLYVVNSNSDLRYNAGTIVAVDLDLVRADRESGAADPTAWEPCPTDSRYVPSSAVGRTDKSRCCWDALDPTILNCDEQRYVASASTVRIGSFGGRPVIQQLPADKQRMFLPVRGDTSIALIDVSATPDGISFVCTGERPTPPGAPAPAPFAACEEDWRVSQINERYGIPLEANLPEDRLPNEPYALAVDDDLQLLYVGHLRGGSVSLLDLGDGTDKRPKLLQSYGGIVSADNTGAQGITSVTIRRPGCFGAIYVTSRYLPVVGSFVVYGLPGCGPLDPNDPTSARGIAIVGTGEQLGTGLAGGTETRGIEFVRAAKDAEPDRSFILQRTPPALVGLDTATQSPFAVIEVCQSPTNLVQQLDAAGRTVSLLVTCYDAGEVYVIDPWAPRVRTIIPVGRGPIATVLSPTDVDPNQSARGYVVGFGGNNLVVLDLNPASPTAYRAIQRIGFSSPVPRQVGPQ